MDPSFYADGTGEPAPTATDTPVAATTAESAAPAADDTGSAADGEAAVAARAVGILTGMRDNRFVSNTARLVGRVAAYQTVRVVLFLAVGWFGFTSFLQTSPQRAADTAPATQELPGDRLVAASLEAAAAHFKTHGTFRGWAAPAGQLAATGDTTLVVALVAADGCWMGGHVDLQPPVVQPDPTGEACRPAEVAAVQDHLDALDAPHS